jgi:hypothetical protein
MKSKKARRETMTFNDWIVNQFTSFSVLTMISIVLFNYITTTRAINRQMKENKLYDELQEIKDEIARHDKENDSPR